MTPAPRKAVTWLVAILGSLLVLAIYGALAKRKA